jgi:8-amino-7-oxononanoate synthase
VKPRFALGLNCGTTGAWVATRCVLEWERAASLFFDCEAAVLLGSGYAGGAVMAAALGDDFDVAFVDEQSHANVWDGLAAAGVRVVSFPHRDPEGLAAVLSTDLGARQRPLVVSDGIFPITGALAPVPDYEVVLQPYDGALLWLDDAHGYGVLGRMDAAHWTTSVCRGRGGSRTER